MTQDADKISAKIRDFLAVNFLYSTQGFTYGDDASFLEEGIIDSLGIIEVVAFVEKEFGITVEDRDRLPSYFDSVNKLSTYILARGGGTE